MLVISSFVFYGCGNESDDKKLAEIVIPESDMTLIKSYLDSLVLSNAQTVAVMEAVKERYRYIDGAEGAFNYLKESTVYLYYEGLDSGGVWSKPGAKTFGGSRVSTVNFTHGPVKAKVVAHKELEGNRNYFYVFIDNNNQGWMGRPYIHRDEAGREFLMPNPITGEKVRESYGVSVASISNVLKENTNNLVPSYESIEWDASIPIKYRQEGYSLYRSALLDGYSEVNRLVSQYQATH